MLNEITVLGDTEADAYVKDYYLGDGYRLTFDLSQSPFGPKPGTVFEQEYTSALDPAWWSVADPQGVISVNSGSLWAQGASAMVKFAELIELGGALQLQHGDVMFQAASEGVLGGLYDGGTMRGRICHRENRKPEQDFGDGGRRD